jgi:hypothetical protein
MAATAGSAAAVPLGSFPCPPKAASAASTPDRPSLRRSERSSPMKNRMPEIGAYGSVRGGYGNILTYSASQDCQDPSKGSYAERRSRSGTALTLFIDPIRQPPSAILAGGNRAVLGLALRAIQGDNIAIPGPCAGKPPGSERALLPL